MNKIYHYPSQEQMQVEVILASRNAAMPEEKPLVTMRLRYPRIIHGEVLTHRLFSRNARSSRAVPIKTMLLECTSIPFVPWHWGKNQKGMQADEECNTPVYIDDFEGDQMELSREEAWLYARDAAVTTAEAMMNSGYHKQIPNRLLEPFSWIDVLITSNDWDNFLWLRDHKDAEPHLQDLARLVKRALENMDVQDLKPGEWHMPYITGEDRAKAYVHLHYGELACVPEDMLNEFLLKISAARCARISYRPFDGDASYEREVERYDMLVNSDRVHASPTEHQATPDEWVDYDQMGWLEPEFHGNLSGWIQARKLIPNERHYG